MLKKMAPPALVNGDANHQREPNREHNPHDRIGRDDGHESNKGAAGGL